MTFFPVISVVSLANSCITLLMFLVFFSTQSPSLFAQITHPFANNNLSSSHKKLQKNFDLVLSGVTLRNAIQQISANCGQLIWLDRRVDGEEVVDIDAKGITHGQAIDDLLTRYNLHRVWVGAVPYICLSQHREQVELAYWLIASQDKCSLVKQNCDQWSWSTISTPRDLITQFTQSNQLQIDNLEQIEHDQWSIQTIPSMDAATNLALLLGGFGCTMKHIGKNHWQLQPISTIDAEVAFAYDPSFLKSLNAEKRKAWQTNWSEKSTWKTQLNQSWLKAPIQAHRELFVISLNLVAPPVAQVANEAAVLRTLEKKRFTIQAKGRLMDILPKILQPLGLTWNSGDLLPPIGERLININSNGLTVDELLQEIARDAECEIIRNRLTITIKSK